MDSSKVKMREQQNQSFLEMFMPPSKKSGRKKRVYFLERDNSNEFIKVSQDLHWTHDTPHLSERNGIADRAVRRIKEGTASAVVQKWALPDGWWDCAMECDCCLRKVHDKMADERDSV